jgi:hypothetical protein
MEDDAALICPICKRPTLMQALKILHCPICGFYSEVVDV